METKGLVGNYSQKWILILKKRIRKHIWQPKNRKQFFVLKN